MGGKGYNGRKWGRHGLTNHWAYPHWNNMRVRVYGNNPNSKNYKKNNIDICPEWDSAVSFCYWADQKRNAGEWQEGWTLGRIDNLQGYSPENCRFEPMTDQLLNREPYGKIKFRGVHCRQNGKFRTIVPVNGREIFIGYFATKLEGAAHWDLYVKKNNLPNRLNFADLEFDTIEEFWLELDVEISIDDIMEGF